MKEGAMFLGDDKISLKMMLRPSSKIIKREQWKSSSSDGGRSAYRVSA